MKLTRGGVSLSGRDHGSRLKEQITGAEKATAMPAHCRKCFQEMLVL